MNDDDNAMPPAIDPEAENPVTPAAPEPTPKPRRVAWLGYLVLFGVVALGAGGWFLLQELRTRQAEPAVPATDNKASQQLDEVTHQYTALQAELSALHSQLATVQSRLSNDDTQLQQRLAEQGDQFAARLDATRSEFGAAVQQIQRQLNKTRGDLLITDAEYLLSIANQKLHLVGDVKSVLAALEAADQRLHESADPAVFRVREVLAGELAALRKMPAIDVVGVSSRLVALESKVQSLPLILPHAGTIKEHEKLKAAEPPPPDEEGDAFDNTLRGIKNLVTVRRTDRPIEAVLAPEQAEALREMLLLKLEATRAALLRSDGQLYRDCLATAIEWIGLHFDPASPETVVMREELHSLAQESLSVNYPDISKSLIMLQNIEKLRLEAENRALRGEPDSKPDPAPAGAPASEPAGATPEPAPVTAPPAGESGPEQPATPPQGSTGERL